MISQVRARGVASSNRATLDLIDTFDADVPTGVRFSTTLSGYSLPLTHVLFFSPGACSSLAVSLVQTPKVQLLATSAAELRKALARLDALAATSHPHFHNIRAVDLNFGCPSPDIIRAGGRHLLARLCAAAAACGFSGVSIEPATRVVPALVFCYLSKRAWALQERARLC